MDKKLVLAEIKEMYKAEGKEHLLEFAEDIAILGWKSLKIVAKHTDNKLDDMAVAAGDAVVMDLLDKIDGKEG